jgi:hypothetical protein
VARGIFGVPVTATNPSSTQFSYVSDLMQEKFPLPIGHKVEEMTFSLEKSGT